MDRPLTVWYCDVCGCQVNDSSEGYVIWQTSDNLKSRNFKIIHQGKCDRTDFSSSAALNDFLGPEGVAYLLSQLSLGPIKKLSGQSHSDIIDLDEYVDFFRRVQTPYYEEARRSFRSRELLEEFCTSNEFSPYLPNNLKDIINRFGTERQLMP